MNEHFYIVNIEGAIVRDSRYLVVIRGAGESHAAGALALVGGKLEGMDERVNALEATLRREILEEVGVEVGETIYLYDNVFRARGDSVAVLDVIFLCQYQSGEASALDPDEVAAVYWLTADEIYAHPAAPPWLHTQIEQAESLRQRLGW